jgi:hypothetical protein
MANQKCRSVFEDAPCTPAFLSTFSAPAPFFFAPLFSSPYLLCLDASSGLFCMFFFSVVRTNSYFLMGLY